MTFHFIGIGTRIVLWAGVLSAIAVSVHFAALIFGWIKYKNTLQGPQRIVVQWSVSGAFAFVAAAIMLQFLFGDFYAAALSKNDLILDYQWPRSQRSIPYPSIEKVEVQRFKRNRCRLVVSLPSETIMGPTIFDPSMLEAFVNEFRAKRDAR